MGVGKTEVALRAAFKCVMGGKQCAILAPTTLLAWQHYNTILSRMEAGEIRIGASDMTLQFYLLPYLEHL